MALLTFLGYLAIGAKGRGILAGGVPIHDALTPAVQLAFFVAVIGLALTLGGSVPCVLWLVNRGQLRLSRLLVFGTIIANVPFALIVGATVVATVWDGSFSASVARRWYGAEGAFRFVLIGTAHGAMAAVVFWLVAVRGCELETNRS